MEEHKDEPIEEKDGQTSDGPLTEEQLEEASGGEVLRRSRLGTSDSLVDGSIRTTEAGQVEDKALTDAEKAAATFTVT